jgi:hypothetical protein
VATFNTATEQIKILFWQYKATAAIIPTMSVISELIKFVLVCLFMESTNVFGYFKENTSDIAIKLKQTEK